METSTQTMGKRIAALRKKKSLTQEQLAQRLGVTPQAVSKWENDLSCPDISILPDLARELEVSVDALLGSSQQEEKKEPKQYIVISKETEGEEDTMKEEKGKFSLRFNLNAKGGALIPALLLIGAGVLFLLQEMGVLTLAADISLWSIVWPLLVLAAGISTLTSEVNACTVAITVFGLYKFLYNLGLLPLSWNLTWGMAWPMILIVIGLTVMQEALFPKSKHKRSGVHNGKNNVVSHCGYKDGILEVECSFGEMHPCPEGPFVGGRAEVNFGSCTLDLTKCESFAENATLETEVNFGDMKIIVPSHVKVEMDAESAFGSSTAPTAPENTTSTLTIKGDCNFGNLQVRYGE